MATRIIRDDNGKTKDKSKANMGKEAEEIVEAHLKKVKAECEYFDYQRLYDAHTAGGFFPAQIADFEFFSTTGHGCIEVKEIKHDYRLPQAKFKAAKHARLKRRQEAGGVIFIVVRFMPLGFWRVIPLEYFLKDSNAASWDVREFPALLASTVFASMNLPRGTA